MAEQLSIFGHWEPVCAEALAPERPPPTPPPPPAPVDPRQVDLLSGAPLFRAALDEALVALDAEGVRRAHQELVRRFLGQSWAERAPRWADDVEWLVGTLNAPLELEAQVARALELSRSDAALRLDGAPSYLVRAVRAAALRRASERLLAERGAAAELADGRPAGWLLLLAGEPAAARAALEAGCAALSPPRARWLGYLGEAAWRCGDASAALAALSAACLQDAKAVDLEVVTCTPLLDLVDLGEDLELEPALDYLPVLADLRGVCALQGHMSSYQARSPAQRLAERLAWYRTERAKGGLADDAARLAAKRELLALAPGGLKELLRRLS